MNRFIALIALLTVLALAIAFGVNSATAPARIRAEGQARAMVIQAQGQARQDTAMAMLPFVLIGSVVVVGLTIFGLIVLLVIRQSENTGRYPVRVIEQRTVLLLPAPEMSRQDLYRLIEGAEVRRIGDGRL